jgi:hypothetical protein
MGVISISAKVNLVFFVADVVSIQDLIFLFCNISYKKNKSIFIDGQCVFKMLEPLSVNYLKLKVKITIR